MEIFINFLKRISWVLLVIIIAPFYAFTAILFLALSPILVLVRYVIKWDDLFDAVGWVWDDLLEGLFNKLFGWVFTIRPN